MSWILDQTTFLRRKSEATSKDCNVVRTEERFPASSIFTNGMFIVSYRSCLVWLCDILELDLVPLILVSFYDGKIMWMSCETMLCETSYRSWIQFSQNFCLSSMGMYTVNNWLSAVALTYILLVIWCGSYSRAALIRQRCLFQKWVKQWLNMYTSILI